MKTNRYTGIIAIPILIVVLCLPAWNARKIYQFERTHVREQIENAIGRAAAFVQNQNAKVVDAYTLLLTDKDYQQKMAFAAGFMRNMGPVQVAFDTVIEPPRPEKHTVTITVPDHDTFRQITINQSNQLKVNPSPSRYLGIACFDSMLQAELGRNNVAVGYTILNARMGDTTTADTVVSAPFILRYSRPDVYCVHYTLPAALVLRHMLPSLMSTACIYALLLGGAWFLYRSYRLQVQLSQFRESLFGNITHELKTPLSSLQLIMDNAGKNAQDGDTVGMPVKHLGFANQELDRMKLLVDRILSFTRMNKEQFALDKQPVQLAHVIADAIGIMELKTMQAGGSIAFDPETDAMVLGDPLLLTNALVAIIDNAIKYTSRRPQVAISLHSSQGQATITIRDNGIGIPRKYRSKVFAPLFRVPEGNVYNTAGHGLGLSFARQIVMLHGGTITLDSNDEGTTFFIKLNMG